MNDESKMTIPEIIVWFAIILGLVLGIGLHCWIFPLISAVLMIVAAIWRGVKYHLAHKYENDNNDIQNK